MAQSGMHWKPIRNRMSRPARVLFPAYGTGIEERCGAVKDMPKFGKWQVHDHKPYGHQVKEIEVVGNGPVPESGKLHQGTGKGQQGNCNNKQPVRITTFSKNTFQT